MKVENHFKVNRLYLIFLRLWENAIRVVGMVFKARVFFEIRNFKIIFSLTFEDIIGRHLYVYGCWEPFQSSLIKNILKSGDVALDVGAHHGFYTLFMSQLVGNSGKIYSFEPSNLALEVLNKHLLLNETENVKLFGFALGSETSDSVSFIPGDGKNTGSAHISNSAPDSIITERIQVRELDSIQEIDFQNVRVIKVDVEGHEDFFIQGAKRALSRLGSGAVIFLEVFRPNGKSLREIIPSFTSLSDDFRIYVLPTDYSSKLFFKQVVNLPEVNFSASQIWGETADLYIVRK